MKIPVSLMSYEQRNNLEIIVQATYIRDVPCSQENINTERQYTVVRRNQRKVSVCLVSTLSRGERRVVIV